MQEELKRFFESKDGQRIIGQIVLNAINQALMREIRFEDGKSEPGRVVEKTELRNVLDVVAEYLPAVEGAVRGCQADSAMARNRARETRDALIALGNIHASRTVENVKTEFIE